MVKIEDKMGEWMGELKFSTSDGTDFCIKPKISHKRKLQLLQEKAAQKTSEDKDIELQSEQVKSILKESYPEFSDEQLDGVLMSYETEILLELYFAWKWRDRKAWEAIQKQQEKEIAKLLEGDVDKGKGV